MYVANLCKIHEVPCGNSVFKLLCHAVKPVSEFQKKLTSKLCVRNFHYKFYNIRCVLLMHFH